MQEIKIKIGDREYTINNNSNKYDRAKKDAGENTSPEQILAHYDRMAGLIKDENGNKIENGRFWGAEKKRMADEPRQLRYKTDEELMEIMRNSIDNQHVPSSIYHKAKQELEFRNSQKQTGDITQRTNSKKEPIWVKYRDEIIIGIIVTVVGGIVLSYLL